MYSVVITLSEMKRLEGKMSKC